MELAPHLEDEDREVPPEYYILRKTGGLNTKSSVAVTADSVTSVDESTDHVSMFVAHSQSSVKTTSVNTGMSKYVCNMLFISDVCSLFA